jgi:hypothetical protein
MRGAEIAEGSREEEEAATIVCNCSHTTVTTSHHQHSY